MNKLLTVKLFLLAAVFVLASCGVKKADNNDAEQAVAQDETFMGSEKVEYPLPTPFELTKMLNNAGAGYIFDMSNSADNIQKYMTEKAQAVNVGIYGADLSYATAYNKIQETQIYLNCSRQLTEELGISGVFDESIIKKIDQNIENNDSLHAIISTTFYETFEYLNGNNKGAVSVMILAGGYIEGMYIASQISYTAGDNAQVIKGISEQKVVTEQLLTVMKTYEDNLSVKELIVDLLKIAEVYRGVKDGGVLNDAQMSELAKIVEEMRNKHI